MKRRGGIFWQAEIFIIHMYFRSEVSSRLVVVVVGGGGGIHFGQYHMHGFPGSRAPKTG